jgi:hypothetical protein
MLNVSAYSNDGCNRLIIIEDLRLKFIDAANKPENQDRLHLQIVVPLKADQLVLAVTAQAADLLMEE